MDKDNRVGPSDRTHLAYAVSYNDDFFVTNDGDLLHFPLDSNKCRKCEKNTRIIDTEKLKSILNS
jgi:hypothetical protein